MQNQKLWHFFTVDQDPFADVLLELITVGSAYLNAFRVNLRLIGIDPVFVLPPQLLVVKPPVINIFVSFIDFKAPFGLALRVIQIDEPCGVIKRNGVILRQYFVDEFLLIQIAHIMVEF